MRLANRPQLHWEAMDIERRVGFRGARYTGTNSFLTFGLALVITVGFYVVLSPFATTPFATMFLERGGIPYFEVFFSSWCLSILFIKWRKLVLQGKALTCSIVPDEPDFVLSPANANEVIENLHYIADDPKRFMLLNRIDRALANLKNIGRVSDIEEILRSQAENDESVTESTYTLMKGFIWAIPVLGFIGTVQGLSVAIGGFGEVLGKTAEMSEIRASLQSVTGGLAVAFETTFIALVLAVCIQLIMTAIKGKEEAFLDACNEYCHQHITSKLRTMMVDESKQIEGSP